MSDRIKPKRQIADVRQLRYSDGKERYSKFVNNKKSSEQKRVQICDSLRHLGIII